MAEMGEDMLELLDCPVCFDTIFPPIFQCPNGHTICARCKLTINNTCPTCRSEMGDIRALILEKMVAPMRLHCKYRTTGCNEVIRYDSKAQHEETCRFRPYNCPHPCGDGTTTPCGVKGDIPSLIAHMRSVHGSTLEVSSIINSLCRHVDPYSGRHYYSSNISMYKYMGYHFCLNFEAFLSPQDLVYMVFLTFVGEDFDAMDYRYSLEIGNETRKMIWVGDPRGIRETRDRIRESSDGLIIHQNVVQNFSESNSMEELTLRVKGFIWKDGSGVQRCPYDFTGRRSSSISHESTRSIPGDDVISRQFDRVLASSVPRITWPHNPRY